MSDNENDAESLGEPESIISLENDDNDDDNSELKTEVCYHKSKISFVNI